MFFIYNHSYYIYSNTFSITSRQLTYNICSNLSCLLFVVFVYIFKSISYILMFDVHFFQAILPVPFPVVISGARGAFLNGVYKPTDEVCDGKVVYQKDGGVMWIEYNISKMMWMIRDTTARNTALSCARSDVTEEKILSSNVTGWEDHDKDGKWVASRMVFY